VRSCCPSSATWRLSGSRCIPDPSRASANWGAKACDISVAGQSGQCPGVFEVMVRPLIRLSLGKRQPMRRVVQARTLSPITSVAGRKGYLRGQLMRDQDSGEYLVQALAERPGRHRICWQPLPKQTVWS